MYALMAEGDDIREFDDGSTHTTIYFPEIRALHICLPPIEEQAEVVRKIEVAFDLIDKIGDEYSRAEQLVPKLDQAILTKAFRGELVPQDPRDEPTSALLERIKAQREISTSTRRGRARRSFGSLDGGSQIAQSGRRGSYQRR